MLRDNLSPALKKIVAKTEAQLLSLKIFEMGTEHLILSLLQENCSAKILMQSLTPFFDQIISRINHLIEQQYPNQTISLEKWKNLRNKKLSESNSLTQLFYHAEMQAMNISSVAVINTPHIILGMLVLHDDPVYTILLDHDITYEKYLQQYLKEGEKAGQQGIESNIKDTYYDISEAQSSNEDVIESEMIQAVSKKYQKPYKKKTPTLDKYCKDFTRLAAKGLLDPVSCRQEEIDRIIQIIVRRKKNNVLLIGEAGVGKTAILEGLAMNIIDKKVPLSLMDKRVMELSLTSLVAGTKYRGQFEERINTIITEVSKSREVILFIDEFHTVVGAGSASGSLDVANIIKPALARGEMQCIAATTLGEYKEYIEKDLALVRRFRNVMIKPTTAQQTLSILKSIKTKYEKYHNVVYTTDALEACIKYTERYFPNRYFPDKAIDIIDEIGAYASIKIKEKNKFSKELIIEKKNLDHIRAKNTTADFLSLYQKQELKQAETEQLEIYQNKLEAWKLNLKSYQAKVSEKDVMEVVSNITRVPIKEMGEQDIQRLSSMKQNMYASVIGQDHVLEKVVKSVSKSLLGIRNHHQPIGVFLFVGQTGVGKTEIAKSLAKHMFGSKNEIIRLDMSEYMEKHTISRLIGSPPGYIGYREGGQLTEKVKKTPYAVLLLDELEKAHEDTFNILLQIMDEGKMEDSLGQMIDFSNLIIIMTSNIGSHHLSNLENGIGFEKEEDNLNTKHKAKVMKSIEMKFSPEFINRIDDVIIFNTLTRENISKILDIQLQSFQSKIYERLKIQLEIPKQAKDFLLKESFKPKFGARHIQRTIQNHIEDNLLEYLLTVGGSKNQRNGKIISNLKIVVQQEEGKQKIFIREIDSTKSKVIKTDFNEVPDMIS